MDSGNSGSLQSSSGGEDDFDSRGGGGGGVDSSPLSALLRPTPSPSSAGAFSLHGSLYGLQDFTSAPPQHQQQQHHQQQQQQQQQQAAWSSAQYMPGAPSSSSQRAAPPSDAGVGSSAHHQPPDVSAAAATAPAPPRGSRKRARASRRAPTTVLTTDTSNFRAMVQEFTGIPNPPFAAGAGVPGAPFGTRFDHIFSSSSNAALRSAADPTSSLPPYLLRPFAQKLQTAQTPSPFASFASPSSSTPPGGPNANVNATMGTAAATTANQRAGDDFQLPSSALLRMQQDHQSSSSYLSFQNLLGSTQPTSQQQHMFGGMSHAAPRMHDQSPSQLLSGLTHGHGGMMVSEGMQHMHQQRTDVHQHQGGDELSGLVRAGASGSGSCKPNYSSHPGASSSSAAAASTDAPPDAASRPGRGEGPLDPWLCTSE
ncbi:developmental regulatory protein wetA-like [Lolium rigidum]|uniref:developmental regulatory protein wetA-like n=1 Tax=Lolium rigidum TaxID=89674 RepID=UPI001F5D5CE9|nr:developmental regulatory protein wetA-like [Lolium rigidum]